MIYPSIDSLGDPLYGSAIVRVIPEPGTVVFFGLSAAWCLRRRHVGP